MYNSGNSSKNVVGSSIIDGTVEAADLATAVNNDIALGVAALPRSGGTMTSNIEFANTKGIAFSATPNEASMTSELLDDYEKGTWTVNWTGSVSDPTGVTQFTDARYVKVGDAVHCVLHTYLQAFTGGSGDIRISLPALTNSLSKHSGAMGKRVDWTATAAPSSWYSFNGDSFITLLSADSADARDNVTTVKQWATLTTYDEVYITFTFFTDF
jgi:hypothetical protein